MFEGLLYARTVKLVEELTLRCLIRRLCLTKISTNKIFGVGRHWIRSCSFYCPSHQYKLQQKLQPQRKRERERDVLFMVQTSHTHPKTAIFCHRLRVYYAYSLYNLYVRRVLCLLSYLFIVQKKKRGKPNIKPKTKKRYILFEEKLHNKETTVKNKQAKCI